MMLGDELHTAHKKKQKYTFYTHVLKVNINFQHKIKVTLEKLTKLNDIINIPSINLFN